MAKLLSIYIEYYFKWGFSPLNLKKNAESMVVAVSLLQFNSSSFGIEHLGTPRVLLQSKTLL